MVLRKYFKHGIAELEVVFSKSGGDFAVLEELEEELQYRSTQRAQKLLQNIQVALSVDQSGGSQPQAHVSDKVEVQKTDAVLETNLDETIDWDDVIQNQTPRTLYHVPTSANQVAITNQPTDILDTWTALEALSPQSYKKPNDLITGDGSIVYLKSGQEPWFKGEKSKPKKNLYYLLYLGAVDLEKSTAQLLDVYADKRIEKPNVKGLASLGVIVLDKKGVPIPENGLAISSFGWSYIRALKSKLYDLKSWETAESVLKEGLTKLLYRENEDGEVVPISLADAQKAFEWLQKNCELPENECVQPSFAVRLYQPFSRGEPEAPLLNSFYLDDLQRARHLVEDGSYGKALGQYLGIVTPEEQYDVLADKKHIETALQPKNMPLGRWPSNGRYPLVLLQQTAVNLAINSLEQDGLFSVNGPPGTGKTTLLRDVVASVIIERAKALYKFEKVDDAFKHAGQIKLGNSFAHIYELDESIRGHEMLVASTNNKAVENVSRELPLKEQVADDIPDLNYFKTISDSLSDDNSGTWGTIAAVLGNSQNRGKFVNKAWWDYHSGLKNYFRYVTGWRDFDIDEDENEITPKIIQECDPPEDLEEAHERWLLAREEFDEKLINAQRLTKAAQFVYESYAYIDSLNEQIKRNSEVRNDLSQRIQRHKERASTLTSEIENCKINIDDLKSQRSLHKKSKPWFFKRLFLRPEWKQWQQDDYSLLSELKRYTSAYKEAHKELSRVEKKLAGHLQQLEKLDVSDAQLNKKIAEQKEKIQEHEWVCQGRVVTSQLWQKSHEEQQKAAPSYTDKAHLIRDELFIASIKLHKAFADVSTKKIRQNLQVFFACLNGGGLPHDKQHLLPHIWSTAFLTTPVISSAFASVGRMLQRLPKESIGWLLVDEAGQASPQAAIGAIYRAKRVVCVGDPLQIEPVVTLPPSIVENLSKHMGVEPYVWTAPSASVQTVADNANPFGTTIERDLSDIRIGSPLLVHRRCEDPMFSISNKLAYNGLMVHATKKKHSEITTLFGEQTAWFDIQGRAVEKWCPEEGDYVADMLVKAWQHFHADPDIFVITPFRNVAFQMRQRMKQEQDILKACGAENVEDWIDSHIGTVHTFQGKEANAVVFLLGAPSPAQSGARGWAASNINLLNVAVSRAKQNFYVVGNKKLWADTGKMKKLVLHT